MKSTLPLVILLGAVSFSLVGCTFPSSRRTVPIGQANVLQRAELGTVTSVREVNIEGQKGQLGLYGGGLVGAAAASGGRGVGGAVVQATGAVVGAVAGQAVEEVATRKRAQEISIRLDDGNTVTVTQEVSTGLFMDGDRVRVINGGGHARVAMATN
ncbi:outer membrane lipoprotein [Horticoccus sp. 23ND18S-11]|uniref:outer membrane lipoprotein n=1 Tax=Horticoccus sp. 23ND18S-11 TaxID=3391832 RepID=UPI0039C9A861